MFTEIEISQNRAAPFCRLRTRLAAIMVIVGLCLAAGCKSGADSADEETSSVAPQGVCLLKTTLLDQNGKNFSLDSLKGKPVLVDFIYTSCPGPCSMLTAKFANVAMRLGPQLGPKIAMLSITVDPEHDTPQELLKYARQQGADHAGWVFVTGVPAEIERAMNAFKLRRERTPDGSVEHIADIFLVGRDGREVSEYAGSIANPGTMADDLKKALAAG